MTAAASDNSLPSLVVDAMVLHHFAKSDRLDVLGASVGLKCTGPCGSSHDFNDSAK